MILHDNLASGNGYKVRLLLTQLGIPFGRIEYDTGRGETRTPEFLENIDPNGRIPVLETDDGEFLAESDAILFYLAEGTPSLHRGGHRPLRLHPRRPRGRLRPRRLPRRADLDRPRRVAAGIHPHNASLI